jgi:glycosyltransferase involved in cell wall biosynthesis
MLAPSAYYPHVGGIEEVTRQLARALQARGHTVLVLTNRWPAATPSSEEMDGVVVRRIPFALPAGRPGAVLSFVAAAMRASAALIKNVRSFRPDVIHVIGAGPQSVYVAYTRGLLRVPIVFSTAGELNFDAGDIFARSLSLRLGLRRMLRVATAVTACSRYALERLAEFAPTPAPSVVIPNGVDPAEFKIPSEASRENTEPYVLALGRLVRQKGFDVLLRAVARDPLAQSDLRVLIAGDGQERASLERQAADLGIAERVSFVGSLDRERVASVLREASVFAFPSRGEAFGIALLEAMAAGVPAVAAAAGGVPELATHEVNALVVEPEDADGLGSSISRLVNDQLLRARLRAGGLETASRLNWPDVAGRYEALYVAVSSRSRDFA